MLTLIPSLRLDTCPYNHTHILSLTHRDTHCLHPSHSHIHPDIQTDRQTDSHLEMLVYTRIQERVHVCARKQSLPQIFSQIYTSSFSLFLPLSLCSSLPLFLPLSLCYSLSLSLWCFLLLSLSLLLSVISFLFHTLEDTYAYKQKTNMPLAPHRSVPLILPITFNLPYLSYFIFLSFPPSFSPLSILFTITLPLLLSLFLFLLSPPSPFLLPPMAH